MAGEMRQQRDSSRIWAEARKENSPLVSFDLFSQNEFNSHSEVAFVFSSKGSQYFLSMLPNRIHGGFVYALAGGRLCNYLP